MFVSTDDAVVRNDEYAMKFATHKKEAEDFIIDKCDDLLPSILRPGPVYKHGITTEWK